MRKIAFWETIGDAYRFVFSNLERFFRLGSAWIVVHLFVFIYLISIVGPTILARPYSVQQLNAMEAWQKAHPLLNLAYLWPALIIGMLAYTAFVVAWHRSVLLGERRSAVNVIRFRRREWRFLWFYSRIGFLIIVPVVIFLIVGAVFATDLSNMGQPLYFYGFIAITYLAMIIFSVPLARLTLGLPAIAVDEAKGIWRRAWRRGRHNTFRIFFGAVVCGLPLGLLAYAIGAIGKYVGMWIGDDNGWSVIEEAALLRLCATRLDCSVSPSRFRSCLYPIVSLRSRKPACQAALLDFRCPTDRNAARSQRLRFNPASPLLRRRRA